MRWLFALTVALATVAAGVLLWRRRQQQASEMWSDVKDSTSSWFATAEEQTAGVTETVAAKADQAGDAASDLVDKLRES